MSRPRREDELIARIEQAFAGVHYPGDDQLTDSSYGEEPAALVEAFRGRTDWRVLSGEFLNQAPDGWASALSFFSAAAYRFYLPAYLIADIKGQLDAADPLTRLCMFVTPQGGAKKIAATWAGGTMGERARADFALFDAAQAGAVVAYLWWRLASDGYDAIIEQALEHYWLERDEHR